MSQQVNSNVRYTPEQNVEQKFRQQVRELLDLHWDARDHVIIEEVRRLKNLDTAVSLVALNPARGES